MSQVDEHVRAQIAHYGASRVPPVEQILDRHRRRRAHRQVSAALAAVTVAAGLALAGAVPSLTTDRSGGELASDAPGVPAPEERGLPDLLEPGAGVPAVVPVSAPDGYRYETASVNRTSDGLAYDSRSVVLRPAELGEQPTVELCSERSDEAPRCLTQGVVLRRELDGFRVLITLSGPGAEGAAEIWSGLELTTDPASSDLFADG